MGVLYTILMFIIAISILVAVHEFGHFWVAKRLGVKVLRFSIGMGKPLLIKRAGADQTEYVLSALPIGGYVKMLGEHDDDVPEHELHRAFNRQPVWKRSAIVLAGPMFNLLFAVIVYMIWYMMGITGQRPIINEVLPGTPAAEARLEVGAEIVRIDNRLTPNWEEVQYAILPAIVGKSTITIETRAKNGVVTPQQVNFEKSSLNQDLKDPFRTLGVVPYTVTIEPIVAKVLDDKPAAKAGIKAGDRITRLNDNAITDFRQIIQFMAKHCSGPIQVEYERNGTKHTVQLVNDVVIQHGRAVNVLGITPQITEKHRMPDEYIVTQDYTLAQSVVSAIGRTKTMTLMTFQLIGKILTLEFSFRNVGSVIQIASVAGQSASIGFDRFLVFLAIVSISLGVMNLLPIPILDGGHLLYYLVEVVTGNPVSEKVEYIGQRIGLFILMMLMMLAFYNDILRMFVPEECPRF